LDPTCKRILTETYRILLGSCRVFIRPYRILKNPIGYLNKILQDLTRSYKILILNQPCTQGLLCLCKPRRYKDPGLCKVDLKPFRILSGSRSDPIIRIFLGSYLSRVLPFGRCSTQLLLYHPLLCGWWSLTNLRAWLNIVSFSSRDIQLLP
jgi:hypothetical protein